MSKFITKVCNERTFHIHKLLKEKKEFILTHLFYFHNTTGFKLHEFPYHSPVTCLANKKFVKISEN